MVRVYVEWISLSTRMKIAKALAAQEDEDDDDDEKKSVPPLPNGRTA